jgi:hypothetical protein
VFSTLGFTSRVKHDPAPKWVIFMTSSEIYNILSRHNIDHVSCKIGSGKGEFGMSAITGVLTTEEKGIPFFPVV